MTSQRSRSLAFLTTVSLTALTPQMISVASINIRGVETAFIQHRRAIESAHIVVTTRTRRHSAQQPETARYTIRIDSHKYRIDAELAYPPGRAVTGKFTHSFVRRDGLGYFYTTEQTAPGVTVVPSIRREQLRHAVGESRRAPFFPSPDPRSIGSNACSFLRLSNYDLESFIGNMNMEKLIESSAAVEELDGASCVRLRYVRPHGVASVWMDPNRDYEVMRIEKNYQSSVRSMSCQLQVVPGYGWFPKHIVYTEREPGTSSRLIMKQEADVEVVSLNRDLADSVFTFRGMGVPIGTVVHDHSVEGGRQLVVTESGLVPASTKPTSRPIAQDDTRTIIWFWMLLGNGAVLVALGVFLLIRRWK